MTRLGDLLQHMPPLRPAPAVARTAAAAGERVIDATLSSHVAPAPVASGKPARLRDQPNRNRVAMNPFAVLPPADEGTRRALRSVKRIGVMDDDIVFIRFVQRALATAGIAVEPVTTFDLAEAVHVIVETACDAVFVDLFMYEGVHGFDCVERLRADGRTRDLPLVVTTGAHDLVARRAQFLTQHGCLVLLKPFSVEELLDAIHAG